MLIGLFGLLEGRFLADPVGVGNAIVVAGITTVPPCSSSSRQSDQTCIIPTRSAPVRGSPKGLFQRHPPVADIVGRRWVVSDADRPPIAKPAGATFVYGMLAGRTQSDIPDAADTVFVSANAKPNRPRTTSGSRRSAGRPTTNWETCARRARTNTSAASRRTRQSWPPLRKQPGRPRGCCRQLSIRAEHLRSAQPI
jgi:hypothetical protein